MVAIPIISGIAADVSPDFRTALPVNMVPTPKATGISEGYLSITDGLVQIATGTGPCRGGIAWNGLLFRVMGTKLVMISSTGTVFEVGDVGGTGPVSMTYGFDYLAVASGGKLFLWDGAGLRQVTDPDLGEVIDVRWIDGYFMTTDGRNLVVTELNNPFSINPLKYGSSEIDPDPIRAVLRLRSEIYAVNSNTVEVFQNVGGDFFPFQRVNGAQMSKGTLGTHTCAVFMDNIVLIGGGRNESPSVWAGDNGAMQKIATREVDTILHGYTEKELASAFVEARLDKDHEFLMLHLPRETLVFDGTTSKATGTPVWHVLSSALDGGPFLARHYVWIYDKWNVGHPTLPHIGQTSREVFTHWGLPVQWKFGTPIIFNEGAGVQFNELELICLTGSTALGDNPIITTRYSTDGVVWSQDRPCRAGREGGRNKPIKWLRQGSMRKWRIQEFRGTSDAPLTVARLEAKMEPLAW